MANNVVMYMTTRYGTDEYYFVSVHPMLQQGLFPYEIHRIKD